MRPTPEQVVGLEEQEPVVAVRRSPRSTLSRIGSRRPSVKRTRALLGVVDFGCRSGRSDSTVRRRKLSRLPGGGPRNLTPRGPRAIRSRSPIPPTEGTPCSRACPPHRRDPGAGRTIRLVRGPGHGARGLQLCRCCATDLRKSTVFMQELEWYLFAHATSWPPATRCSTTSTSGSTSSTRSWSPRRKAWLDFVFSGSSSSPRACW